ncbi:hypothetical protein QQ045_013662 [Rhodiola kirilowii]
MFYQLLNSEVGEGSNTSSVAPVMWSSADNNTNFAEANQSFFLPMGSFCTNSYHLSPHYGFSSHKEIVMAPPSHDKYYIAESYNVPQLNNNGAPSEFCMMDVDALPVPSFTNAVAEGGHFIEGSIPSTQFNLKRKVEVSAFQSSQDDITSEIPKKKTRAMKHACGNKVSKKKWKTFLDGNEEEAINSSKQVSSSYSSDDDSNASQEFNAGILSDSKVAGKKTGRRGSAIDPQSLYARKRRDRINKRLRILQNLVPNGTKVDISTMLEEAVNYVKFLQTQIKLLSSDDLWMYAPIAYNGVDIGLDRKLSQNL